MAEAEQNIHVNMVTFQNIPYMLQREMAKFLDTTGEASWEALADWLGHKSGDIQVLILCYSVITCFFLC